MFPFCAASEPSKLVRTLTGCTLAKMSRMIANTNIPTYSVATPMLLRIDSRRTPYALMRVVMINVPMAMNVNIDVNPPGLEELRKGASGSAPIQ